MDPSPVRPGRLVPGDTIFVASPASPPIGASYDRGVAFLRRHGFRVIEGKGAARRHLLFAGNALERADEINGAFKNGAVKAIMCSQGGAGTAHLLPLINFSAVGANPKIFIGYSDVTALQVALFQRTGLVTFQGPMVASDLGRRGAAKSWAHLVAILTGVAGEVEIGSGALVISPGRAEGILTGGCLSIVAASLGTPYEIDTRGRILFLEDVDEKPHRIDRYLRQLLQAQKLQAARGIIFGSFVHCDYEAADRQSRYGVDVVDIIREYVEPLRMPCLYGLPFGHVNPKATIPHGGEAVLDATAGSLKVMPSVR